MDLRNQSAVVTGGASGMGAVTASALAARGARVAVLDLNQTAAHPKMMVASDWIYEVPHPHPRSYGCFAQVLRKFVRERKIISLEEAIWKMSGFPAERFGLTDRGQIAEGFGADLVVLNPETVADRATWGDPIQSAVGIDYVMVNGELVISEAKATGKLPGRLLRR